MAHFGGAIGGAGPDAPAARHRRLAGKFSARYHPRADLCDLADKRGQAATTLSGGEFARAMLARAIVSEPQILIVDEPITGLDPRHAMASLQLLSRFAQNGTLVIASLHDLTLAARYPGRVIVLVDGAVIGDRDSLTEELIHRAFGVTAFLTGQGDSRAFTLLSPSEK